jgi:nucleotide-binding universal stress UspA family protein
VGADAEAVDLPSGVDRHIHVRGHRDRDHEARLTPRVDAIFSTILVGTDGSDTAKTAVRYAIDLARELGAKLQVVSAYEPVPEGRLRERRPELPDDLEWAVSPRTDVMSVLAEAAADARLAGVEAEVFERQGDAADAIIDVAEEQRTDLIVVGNRGMTGAKRFLLGSVPNRVSHHAPCSVLIVRTT